MRKTALREIRILQRLRHENVVSLLHGFRHKRRICLVFEFVEKTALEALDLHPKGLPDEHVRFIMYQLLRATALMHKNGIIH